MNGLWRSPGRTGDHLPLLLLLLLLDCINQLMNLAIRAKRAPQVESPSVPLFPPCSSKDVGVGERSKLELTGSVRRSGNLAVTGNKNKRAPSDEMNG